MNRRTATRRTLFAVLITTLFFSTAVRAAAPDPSPADGPLLEDAELTAVFFLDPDLGWAVGEQGVILCTENGGRQWELQPSGVTCRLESVHFVDAQHGWAVGGQVHSYSPRASGVVLRTQDGGRSWTPVPGLTIPPLKRVRFFNPQQGWAVGGATTLYPTGVLRTDDGGRSWSAVPSGPGGGWLAGDFRDDRTGVVVGRDGRLGRVAAPAVEMADAAEPALGCWRTVCLADPFNAWAAGDGGRVLRTTDGGQSWTPPAAPFPAGLASAFDFRALAVLGNHLWIAGAPGTCVFHSPDGGRTWELGLTDQTLPLRGLTFVDAQRGWGVGALGTILGTRDGGRTWRQLRGGGTRVALLGIFSEPSRVPWELFAWECAGEGYLGAVELIAQRASRGVDHARNSDEEMAAAAGALVGGVVAEAATPFRLPDPGLRIPTRAVLDKWNRVADGAALDALEARLVRKIRQWRPDVVVTDAPSPQGTDPVGHLLNQLVLAAVRTAADDHAQPGDLTLAGLGPWRVKKVFCVTSAEARPTVMLSTAQLVPRVGCAVADLASEAQAKVLMQYRPVPPSLGLQLLVDELPQSTGRKDLFSGIFLPAGGDARRPAAPTALRDLDALRVAAQKRRNIEQIIASTGEGAPQSAGWLGQVQDLTKSLEPTGAGAVLFQLGQRYLEVGEPTLAAQSFAQLVERYPNHALSESALAWLIQHFASAEVAWQLQRGQSPSEASTVSVTVGPSTAGDVTPAGFAAPLGGAGEGVATAGAAAQGAPSRADFQTLLRQRAAQAVSLSRLIQYTRPELFAEPRVQFPISVAYRHHNVPREAEKLYHHLAASPLSPDWAQCAAAEQWLARGRGTAPKATYHLARAATRPRLDGELDDDLWQGIEPLVLRSARNDDAAWSTSVMLAYDREFLFVAGICRKPPQSPPVTDAVGLRQRDTSLEEHDRLDLLLDIDRDYVSFYRLTVDHRGWAGDACAGDTTWNPTWYIASRETDAQWTFEVAVPLEELTPQPPQAQDVWAVGIQRIVPGVGLQALTHPAATEPLGEGFGWMVFR